MICVTVCKQSIQQPMSDVLPTLKSIFPMHLHDEAKAIAEIIPFTEYAPGYDPIIRTVKVGDSAVKLLYRIYNPVVDSEIFSQQLNETQRNMLCCFYTRHCDGYVREHYLYYLFNLDQDWVAPFVFQLVGEYVIEIIAIINNASEQLLAKNSYKQFIKDNPEFMALLEQRVISYWNCYYRRCSDPDIPYYYDRLKYPGMQFIKDCKVVSHFGNK